MISYSHNDHDPIMVHGIHKKREQSALLRKNILCRFCFVELNVVLVLYGIMDGVLVKTDKI